MDYFAPFIPLIPISMAILIGINFLFTKTISRQFENTASTLVRIAIIISSLLTITLVISDLLNNNSGSYYVGQWLMSDSLTINIQFITSGFSIIAAALFSVILVIVVQFSNYYLHRESGFLRYLFIFSLFSTGMMLITLSGNMVVTFIGWEIAGLCSFLLISYAYDRPIATINATRVFVTNRIGDACFIFGIALTFYYAQTTNWTELIAKTEVINTSHATVIALCFAIAALTKSAQLPFSPWLARAMEGPTPSSAVFYGSVMVHSGVFLTILLQPIFERAPFVMILLIIIGLLTAIYSFIIGLTQTDVKSSICFAITGQIGLMFVECGLGFWELASWHMCAHVIVRAYQVLSSPSLVLFTNGNPMQPVSQELHQIRWLYNSSLQRFWLDPIIDRALVKPIHGLGRDLDYFDSYFIDRAMGSPTTRDSISSLAQLEQKIKFARSGYDASEFGRGKGIAGKIFEWTASAMSWFEERLVLRGIGIEMIDIGKELGHLANSFEKLILKPRYLVVFVLIVLLSATSI